MGESFETVEHLVRVVQDLSRARTVEGVQRIVRRSARALTGADGATFVLRDGDHCYYADEDAIGPLWKGKRFRSEICVSGWAMAHREVVVIADIFEDSRVPIDVYRTTFVRSLVMVPIRSEDPIGAIGAYWASRRTPSASEVAVLRALADSTAIALENAGLYRELEERVRERTSALEAARRAENDARRELEERRRTEERLQRAESELRQAQKMEAIGQLAGGIAHDFNNVLSAILSYSALVMEDLDPDHPVRDDVEQIHRAAERAGALTRQLLAFSRRQILEPKAQDLNAIVRGIEPMIRRLIGSQVKLETRLPPGLDPVLVDTGQMEQVILNLAINARDAMPRGGRLTMETRPVVLDEEYVSAHPGASAGPHLMLVVSDTGIGMDREIQSRIFEPFFTTKPKDKGTGLGLSTVWGIVSQSGGHIRVDSEVGVGTSFEIYLPRQELPSRGT